MITPIYNEPSCSTAACHAHPARQSVLGVLDVALDLRPADRLIAAARRRVVVTIADRVALISAFLVAFISFFVTAPSTASWRRTSPSAAWTSSTRSRSPPAASCGAWRAPSTSCGTACGGARRDQPRGAGAGGQGDRADRSAPAGQRRLLKADRSRLSPARGQRRHEINNPLSGVLNFSALMGRILKDDGIPRERIPSSAATSTG